MNNLTDQPRNVRSLLHMLYMSEDIHLLMLNFIKSFKYKRDKIC